jgi:hypothetical protein
VASEPTSDLAVAPQQPDGGGTIGLVAALSHTWSPHGRQVTGGPGKRADVVRSVTFAQLAAK